MKKSFSYLLCLILSASILLTACSSKEEKPSSNNGEGNTPQSSDSEKSPSKKDVDISLFEYEEFNKNVNIIGYTGTGPSIIFPDEINGKPVVEIGSLSKLATTYKPEDITEISLPSSLCRIADEAFTGFNITEVAIPNSVEQIGSKAFANCSALTKANIPENISFFSFQVFEGTSIKEFTVPSTLETNGLLQWTNNVATGNGTKLEKLKGVKGSDVELTARVFGIEFEATETSDKPKYNFDNTLAFKNATLEGFIREFVAKETGSPCPETITGATTAIINHIGITYSYSDELGYYVIIEFSSQGPNRISERYNYQVDEGQTIDVSDFSQLPAVIDVDITPNVFVTDYSFMKDFYQYDISLDIGSSTIKTEMLAPDNISTVKDAKNITRLAAVNLPLNDYSFISTLTNLMSLNISSCKDFSFMPSLTNLKYLTVKEIDCKDLAEYVTETKSLSNIGLKSVTNKDAVMELATDTLYIDDAMADK